MTTLAFVDVGEVPRHLCQVGLRWMLDWLSVGLRPATVEARLVGVAILRVFAALWDGVDCWEAARHGPRTSGFGD